MTFSLCQYCGSGPHSGMCPRVESIEYHPDGTVRKVTLRTLHLSETTTVTCPLCETSHPLGQIHQCGPTQWLSQAHQQSGISESATLTISMS